MGGRDNNRAVVVDENFLYLILLKFLSELDLRIKLFAVIKDLFRFWTLLCMAVP